MKYYTALFQKRSLLYNKNPSEKAFFHFLVINFGHNYIIVPQVDNIHLLEPLNQEQISNEFVKKFFDFRSIDFVLYDRKLYIPVLAIELNGKYHEMGNMPERDSKKKELVESAGIPLLHFEGKADYGDKEKLSLQEFLKQ